MLREICLTFMMCRHLGDNYHIFMQQMLIESCSRIRWILYNRVYWFPFCYVNPPRCSWWCYLILNTNQISYDLQQYHLFESNQRTFFFLPWMIVFCFTSSVNFKDHLHWWRTPVSLSLKRWNSTAEQSLRGGGWSLKVSKFSTCLTHSSVLLDRIMVAWMNSNLACANANSDII